MIVIIFLIKITLNMYASNEDEYNRGDEDWVFLQQTPPENTVNSIHSFSILFYLY